MNDSISISIFPNGSDKAQSSLIFDSMEDKMAYVKKESTYCMIEENAYLSARGEKRDELKDVFLKKRVEFAKKNGFAPKKRGDQTKWFPAQSTQSTPLGVA